MSPSNNIQAPFVCDSHFLKCMWPSVINFCLPGHLLFSPLFYVLLLFVLNLFMSPWLPLSAFYPFPVLALTIKCEPLFSKLCSYCIIPSHNFPLGCLVIYAFFFLFFIVTFFLHRAVNGRYTEPLWAAGNYWNKQNWDVCIHYPVCVCSQFCEW